MTDTDKKEQEICQCCGLCCDGTLFPRTAIHQSEHFPSTTQDQNKNKWLKQPCTYYENSCTIYNQLRPQDCCDFKCKSLRKFSNGALEIDALKERIKKIKEQKTRLYKLIPNSTRERRLHEVFNDFLIQNKNLLKSPAFKKQHTQLFLEWVSYKSHLKQFW